MERASLLMGPTGNPLAAALTTVRTEKNRRTLGVREKAFSRKARRELSRALRGKKTRASTRTSTGWNAQGKQRGGGGGTKCPQKHPAEPWEDVARSQIKKKWGGSGGRFIR